MSHRGKKKKKILQKGRKDVGKRKVKQATIFKIDKQLHIKINHPDQNQLEYKYNIKSYVGLD